MTKTFFYGGEDEVNANCIPDLMRIFRKLRNTSDRSKQQKSKKNKDRALITVPPDNR